MPAVHAADGTKIHYDTFGIADGEPLVLIMGLAVDQWGWIRQRSHFAMQFRCITIDNRGVGRSGKPAGPYDIFTMTKDVVAVLDAEEVHSAHVVGYSLGGVIAQALAVGWADRVRSLVLASTACRVKDWRRELLASWTELVETKGVPAFARENIRWVAAARHLRWVSPFAPALAPLLVRAPRRGVVGQIAAISNIDVQLHEQLDSITQPTLVIVGSQDILTPVADSEEIVHRIPNARFRVVSGAAHGMIVTDAKLFNRALSDFYTDVLTPD